MVADDGDIVGNGAGDSLAGARQGSVRGDQRKRKPDADRKYIGILAVTNMLLAAAAAERRQAEFAMGESEKRLRAVVEDLTDFVCRFKPDGNAHFRERGVLPVSGQEPEGCWDQFSGEFKRWKDAASRSISLVRCQRSSRWFHLISE